MVNNLKLTCYSQIFLLIGNRPKLYIILSCRFTRLLLWIFYYFIWINTINEFKINLNVFLLYYPIIFKTHFSSVIYTHRMSTEESQQFCLRWHNYQSSLMSTLPQLLNHDDLTDVTLCAGLRTLKAHRVVLSACSDYFKQLFKALTKVRYNIIILGFLITI